MLMLWCVTITSAYAAGRPYDENANAYAALADGQREARETNRNMLVVFGANWCADCLRLDEKIHDDSGRLGEQRFVIVKVNVGRFDRNIDLARKYGDPVGKGIPGAAIVTPDGRTLYSGPLADLLEPHQLAGKFLRYTAYMLAILLAVAAAITATRHVRRIQHARRAGKSPAVSPRAGTPR